MGDADHAQAEGGAQNPAYPDGWQTTANGCRPSWTRFGSQIGTRSLRDWDQQFQHINPVCPGRSQFITSVNDLAPAMFGILQKALTGGMDVRRK